MPTPWTIRNDRLRAIWPGVNSNDVCGVLGHLDTKASPGIRAQIDEALALPGADAACALMAPVASAFAWVERSERACVLDAIDALIRAGGDPAPALPVLAEALGDFRTVQRACVALHRAALAGHSIASVGESLAEASKGKGGISALDVRLVHTVQRLEALQRRGQHEDLATLASVYEQQRPVGNLHGGIGLLEDSLLSESGDEVTFARLALTELLHAGTDSYLAWIALLPVLNVHVRSTSRDGRERAAAALGQVTFAIGRAAELEEREATERTLPLLYPLLEGLAALLSSEDAESSVAAKTIEVFVDIGCSLAAVRDRIDAALGDTRVEVRSACSRALSKALQRAGEETPLPPGRSHRRTYSPSDTPLGDGRKVRCPHCGAMEAVTLYEARDRGNTWDDTTIELKCSACGVYSAEHFGA